MSYVPDNLDQAHIYLHNEWLSEQQRPELDYDAHDGDWEEEDE